MLEKRILEKMIELMADNTAARKMLERSGVMFMLSGGRSGFYKAGMLKLTDSEGVVDFDPSAITGFMLADVGKMGESLKTEQVSLVQDLQNQLAEDKLYCGDLENQLVEKDKLIKAADETLAELQQGAEKLDDILDSGEGTDYSGEGVEDK